MEVNIINSIKNVIDELDSHDPVDMVNNKKKSSELTKLNENEFIILYKDIIEIFRLSIEKKYLYSVSQYFNNRTNNANTDIVQILNQISSTYLNPSRQLNLAAIEVHILESQNYLLQKGLYSLKEYVPLEFSIEEFKGYKSQSRRVSRLLTDKEERLNELSGILDAKLEEITNLAESKSRKLEVIDTKLEDAKLNSSEIDEIKSSLITRKQEVENVSLQIEKIKDDLTDKVSEKIKEIDSKLGDIDKTKLANEAHKENIDDWVKNLGEIKQDTIKTNKTLQELLDPAIAKNLLLTFKSRKRTLFAAKILWAGLSCLAVWLLYHFTSEIFTIADDKKLDLSKTIAAAIRILPFLVLLYFCLRQFTKNRTLEEEYAFRESIATSLMSYAEQITNNPEAKDELIKETVGRLYTSPMNTLRRPLIEKKTEGESDKVIDKITELIKEIKGSLTNTQ